MSRRILTILGFDMRYSRESKIEYCEYCGKVFRKVGYKRFCSKACAGNSLKVISKCIVCGKEFFKKPDRAGLYCGQECSLKGQRVINIIKCDHCGKMFQRHKCRMHSRNYCSRECLYAAAKEEAKGGGCKRKKRREIPLKLRWSVLERDGFRCVYCGLSAVNGGVLHIDHVIPEKRGGKTVASNLVASCETCNVGKGSRLLRSRIPKRVGKIPQRNTFKQKSLFLQVAEIMDKNAIVPRG